MSASGAARTAAWFEVAQAILAFCGVWLLAAPFVIAFGGLAEPGTTPTREQIQIGLAAQLVASIVVLAVCALRPTAAPFRGRGLVTSSVGIYAAFLLVWIPVAFVAIPALWNSQGWPMEPQPHLEYFAGPLSPTWVTISLIAVCLVGPLLEEVLFRGYLQTGLRTICGPRGAVLWSGLVFGLFHVGAGWHVLLPLTMIGWLLGWLRERSGGLLAPVIVHVVHNSLTVGLVVAAPELLHGIHEAR